MRLIYPVLWSRLGREASQEQTVNTAAALARQGADVTLLAPRRRGDPPLDAAAVRTWFGTAGDFEVVQRPSRWGRTELLSSLLWLKQAFRDREVLGADILYSRIPAMLAVGRLSPRPFATDHYRLWPDEYRFLRPLFRAAARSRSCLGLILHSAYARDSYRRAGIAAEKLLVAHNGAGAPSGAPPPGRAQARALLGLPADRPIATYAGRIDETKGLDQLLALADLRPDTLFLLVGSERPGAIEAEAAKRANVAIFPWQRPDALAPFLAAADLLLIPPARAPLERFRTCVLPMKTFPYLAAGRPVLAPRAPDTAGLLVDGVNAVLVEPDRPEAAAAALDRLLGEPALAARLAEGALRTAAGLTWDERARKILGFLESRLAASQASA